jgi:ADP-glucose pyrophosphorylase
VVGCSLKRVLIAEGCNIEHATVEHSIIGVRSQIGDGSIVRDTIMMGADYYGVLKNGSPLGIGRNCDIQGAIIDKNSSIGDNVVIKTISP